MDPMAAILTALTAGAAAALKDTATEAIKDGYNILKGLIERKLQDNPKAEVVLAEHEKDPETWEKPLEQTLTEAKVDQDEEIVKAAEQLLSLVQTQQTGSKYNVQVTGDVQGMVTGDHADVTMNFGGKPENNKEKGK
jgi:hypothetical protein